MIFAARGLGKSYGPAPGFRAVEGVDLSLAAREFVSIVGRSGSGKSTLLAMLGALTRPSEGEITLDGTNIWSMSEARLANFRSRHIGFVFQFPSLLPNLRAVDNVALPALLSGALDADTAYARALDLLASVGLADRAQSFPGAMSGGEQRRAVIARALINSPRLLLADEPTGDLDEDTEAEIIALLDRLRREEGFGLLAVSHNLGIARRADRSYEMSHGVLAPTVMAQAREIARRPARLKPPPVAVNDESTPEAAATREGARLGRTFWAGARTLLFGGAVAFSAVLLADSLVAQYQRMLVRERADKLAALETLALSSLRANVRAVATLGEGRYEMTLELWNVRGEKPIYVMSPSVRAYVQIRRQWIEVPLAPVDESTASVLKITGKQAYRYILEAKLADYAKLFSKYMHVRFVNTMLVSPHSVPSDELFERTDSYYIYLKPWNVADSDILKDAKFDGAPPLWIPMPPH
ncbi:MAG: ABC transporter ATP-binding protein [Chromatiales bacterium]